jgi:hypothetical protein
MATHGRDSAASDAVVHAFGEWAAGHSLGFAEGIGLRARGGGSAALLASVGHYDTALHMLGAESRPEQEGTKGQHYQQRKEPAPASHTVLVIPEPQKALVSGTDPAKPLLWCKCQPLKAELGR